MPRLEKAHVPEAMRTHRTKGRIALDLLDLVRSKGLPGRVVVASLATTHRGSSATAWPHVG